MLADALRERSPRRRPQLHELFRRIVLNVLVGNTDDHPRNHAVFYEGETDELRLTPAYDICPQVRSGGEAAQAMAIGADGERLSNVTTWIAAARVYDLTPGQATEVVEEVLTALVSGWHEAADRARLTSAERSALWGRQICNPFATDGYRRPLQEPPR